MLKLLHIKNFALIEDMEVEFYAGFNVITGETGAGKTILLNAIKAALGERAYTEYIRAGAKKALVQAVFQVEGSFIPYLSDLGIELSDEDMLVFSREINSNGRSLCRINGQVVTLSSYKRAASQMMDMHSQHQQSVMLTKEHHIELLDAYSEKVLKQRDIVKRCYHEWKKKHEMLEELKGKAKDTARQIDLIKFQIKEIESANLEPNE
ncbi:AAA family ATPase, partial [Peptococcaceae bacterium]|nr:AAA family ATPase [Peptococcaceae bacterium]